MAKTWPEVLVGLDIGTNCAVVGRVTDGLVEVLGVGNHRRERLGRGENSTAEATVAGIRQAVDEAEAMAGTRITQVHVAVSGRGFCSRGGVGPRPTWSGSPTSPGRWSRRMW